MDKEENQPNEDSTSQREEQDSKEDTKSDKLTPQGDQCFEKREDSQSNKTPEKGDNLSERELSSNRLPYLAKQTTNYRGNRWIV